MIADRNIVDRCSRETREKREHARADVSSVYVGTLIVNHYDDASDPGAARNREFNLAKALVSVNKLLAACVKPLRITRFVSHREYFLINGAGGAVALN